MPPPNISNGWDRHQKYVTEKLDDHTAWLKSIQHDVSEMRVEFATRLATLKAQSRSWGAIAGVIAAGVVTFAGMIALELIRGNI